MVENNVSLYEFNLIQGLLHITIMASQGILAHHKSSGHWFVVADTLGVIAANDVV